MPVSVLEAYASGTPIVSTSPQGMKYVAQHQSTGLLSEVGNAGALAANIVRLLRDQQLASSLVTGGLKQVEQYWWDVVRAMADYFQSLALD